MRKLKNDIEHTLLNQLRESNVDIVPFVMDMRQRLDYMDSYGSAYDDRIIQLEALKDNSCFRIKLRMDALLFIPKMMQYLGDQLRTYSARGMPPSYMGYVPAYICNINHLTLIHLHNDRIRDYFPDNSNLLGSDVCRKFIHVKGIPMEFSSMNFLKQQSASSKRVSKQEESISRKCFKFSFWNVSPPNPAHDNSTMNNFIYIADSRVHSMYKVYKTIVRINEIDQQPYDVSILSHALKYRKGRVTAVISHEHTLSSKPITLMIPELDAAKLQSGDIISCIVMRKMKTKGQSYGTFLLGIVDDQTQQHGLAALMSMLLWQKTQKLDSTNKFCESMQTSQLRIDTESAIKMMHTVFDKSWLDNFDTNFNSALQEIHPCVLHYDDLVYAVPPTLLNYVMVNNIQILNMPDLLANMMELINTIPVKEQINKKIIMQLRISDRGSELQTSEYFHNHWSRFLGDIPRICNRIMYSRIISKPS